MKTYQREHVLRQGLDLITWTYNPLLARNAQLNIAKLGAVCTTYLPNLYGPMRDGLNAGLPSDRFQVDWWIATRGWLIVWAVRLAIAHGWPTVNSAAGGLAQRPGPDGTPQPPDPSAPVVEAARPCSSKFPPTSWR